ncbi:hypothetical protein Q7P37_004609 [Cladosporium fusiforme]
MSAIQNSSLLPPLHPPPTWIPPIQVQPPPPPQPGLLPPPAPEQGHIIFTRQLWQRTMPEDSNEHSVSTRSQSQGSLSAASHHPDTNGGRRGSSNVYTRSLRSAPSPSGSSKAPLTPEESPPSRSTRKRNAGIVEEEDKEIDSHEVSPVHTRASSGDSTAHVCICQPEPKIPRPRNAFILYRQHHQGKVVAQNPGLANPEISKIIGEQWRNQAVEVKNEWKALAEEEKLRHQQQYPTYRYQPKRNGRRTSVSSDTPGSAGENPKCTKCGGRTILAPYNHHSNSTSPSTAGLPPNTPGSAPTPVSRTLPVLRDLSLQSPASRRARYQNMPAQHHLEERDDIGPLSPDMKRRRFNGENYQPTIQRVMPPRYANVPAGTPVGPGTPFPFNQAPTQHPHVFSPALPTHGASHNHRESLPALRGVISPPGPMAPPPRPGPGYQQHRMSQGHNAPDRSLQLPPLKTGVSNGVPASARSTTSHSVEEAIMSMPFDAKLAILRRLAPPSAIKENAPRGPLIAIEGDNGEAVKSLAKWLSDTLDKDSEVRVKLLESPDVTAKGGKDDAMAEYHMLAAQWLAMSKTILNELEYNATTPSDTAKACQMDLSSTPVSASASAPIREVDENYDDEETTPTKSTNGTQNTSSNPKKTSLSEIMDIDDHTHTHNTDHEPPTTTTATHAQKPISILPLFSLHASNTFACRIPLTHYAPYDHWSWNATQWRGVVGPDLTIYLRDDEAKGKAAVEQFEEERLFVVRRGAGAEEVEIDGATLRRVGFEVGEWVRGFGGVR